MSYSVSNRRNAEVTGNRRVKNRPRRNLIGTFKAITAGGLCSLMLIGAGREARNVIDNKYQVVKIPTSVAQDAGEIGLAYASPTNDEDFKSNIFTGKVTVLDENGKKYRIDKSELVSLSNSFSKSEMKKYSVLYQVNKQASINNNSLKKVIGSIGENTYVLGEEESKDGYVKVVTDKGVKGKMSEDDLTRVFDSTELNRHSSPMVVNTSESGNDKENTLNNFNYVSVNDEVLGMDVTTDISPDLLENLLNGNQETGDIGMMENTKINYVIFRLGAYGWGIHNLSNPESYELENMVKCIEICKKHDIPYGMYVYSTCINEKEGKEEADFVNRSLKTIEAETGTRPNFPIMIDVELNVNENGEIQDRQYNAPGGVEAVTRAKATVFNEIREKNPDMDVALYTAQNPIYETPIFDPGEMIDQVDSMDELKLWWVSPIGVKSHEESGLKIDETLSPKGKKISINQKQVVLDRSIGGRLIDFDVMEEDAFIEYLKSSAQRTTAEEDREL